MSSKKREPLIAFALSILATGLGQLYVGQVKKFIAIITLQVSIIFFYAASSLNSNIYGFWSFIMLALSVHAYSAISAAISAYKQKKYVLKKYNRPAFYISSWLILTTLSALVISDRGTILGYETYQIPSGSMAPTISVGDYILVNARKKSPKVGDVIVYTHKGISFVKRVAAVENDRISIADGKIILNGKNIGNLSAPDEKIKMDYSLTMQEITIKKGELFLLGDNRDNSNDSRFMGAISSTQIIGTVTGIWFSKEISRIGQKI